VTSPQITLGEPKFGTTAGTSVTVVSGTKLTVKAPAVSSAQTVNVTVTTPGGTSPTATANLYAFGGPTVTALSPTAGPTAGGTVVTVTGTGFVSGASVKFGGSEGDQG
jgi:hypothetical protein